MKNSMKALIAATAFAVSGLLAHAQPALKVALVDVAKLYDSHYSLPAQQEKVKAYTTKVQEESDRLMKEGNDLVEKYREAEEQTRNPVLKEDARAAATKQAEALVEEIKKKEEEVQAFRQNADGSIRQDVANFRNQLVGEITKTATELAKKRGFTLVIDKSAISGAGYPVVMHSDAGYDLTEDVLAEINKNKPASVAKPAAGGASSSTTPAAAPAAATPAPKATGDSPAVSFPGVKK